MIAVAILWTVLQTAPAAGDVVVIMDRDSKTYQQAVTQLRSGGHRVQAFILGDAKLVQQLKTKPEQTRWLAMGPRSARWLAQASAKKKAALFVRRNQVPANLSAVTLEVTYRQQMTWMKQAFPGRHRLIVLRQPSDAAKDAAMLQAAEQSGFDLLLADVQKTGDAVPVFNSALRKRSRSAVFWMLPDPVVVSTDTVAPLIKTALAARIPVIGFTDYFLRIGALAAVVVDYGACAQQALELADAETVSVASPRVAKFVVEGRLAERLGIAIGSGDNIEVH